MHTIPYPGLNAVKNYLEWQLNTNRRPWFARAQPDGSAQIVTQGNVLILDCIDLADANMTLNWFLDGDPYDPPLVVEVDKRLVRAPLKSS